MIRRSSTWTLQLPQTAEYALRALAYMATLPPDQAVLESWLSAVGESVLAMFPRWACPFTARPNICIEVQ